MKPRSLKETRVVATGVGVVVVQCARIAALRALLPLLADPLAFVALSNAEGMD